MKTSDRREFLSVLLRGTGIGLLSMLPGTFFHQTTAFAIDLQHKPEFEAKDFKGILQSTNTSNYINVLNASKLSQEQILAIAAVKELNRSVVSQIISETGKPGGDGRGCGGNCALSKPPEGKGCGKKCSFSAPVEPPPPTGTKCATPIPPGSGCGGNCAVPANAMGVIDRSGQLNVDFSRLNIQGFRSALLEAQRLGF